MTSGLAGLQETPAEATPVTCLHGSAVAVGEQAVLITGTSGSGKTTLALELIALGAELIADDRVNIEPDKAGRLWLTAPANGVGLVEMRGFGLLRLAACPGATLKLIADLDHGETDRLPPPRERFLAGVACPVILCKGKPGLASALMCLLYAEDWPGLEYAVRA